MELWSTVLSWVGTRFKHKYQDENKWIIDFCLMKKHNLTGKCGCGQVIRMFPNTGV